MNEPVIVTITGTKTGKLYLERPVIPVMMSQEIYALIELITYPIVEANTSVKCEEGGCEVETLNRCERCGMYVCTQHIDVHDCGEQPDEASRGSLVT